MLESLVIIFSCLARKLSLKKLEIFTNISTAVVIAVLIVGGGWIIHSWSSFTERQVVWVFVLVGAALYVAIACNVAFIDERSTAEQRVRLASSGHADYSEFAEQDG